MNIIVACASIGLGLMKWTWYPLQPNCVCCRALLGFEGNWDWFFRREGAGFDVFEEEKVRN